MSSSLVFCFRELTRTLDEANAMMITALITGISASRITTDLRLMFFTVTLS